MFKKNVNWHYNEQFFCSPVDIKEIYLSVGPKLLTIYAINKITNFFYLKFSCLRQKHVGVNWIKNKVISNRLTLSTSCPKQSNRKFEFPSKVRQTCLLTNCLILQTMYTKTEIDLEILSDKVCAQPFLDENICRILFNEGWMVRGQWFLMFGSVNVHDSSDTGSYCKYVVCACTHIDTTCR